MKHKLEDLIAVGERIRTQGNRCPEMIAIRDFLLAAVKSVEVPGE